MAIKSGQLKEKTDYQAYILEMLRDENSYQVRSADSFEPGYGMDTELLFTFLEATQKDALTRLEKLYKDKADQIAALKRHMEFFNTHPYVASPIVGVTLALEQG